MSSPCSRAIGSSPRVRGKLDHLVPPVRRPRIIPASAGQTLRISAPDRSRPDHPRECGANCQSPRITAVANGSSPRVRGKHDSAAFYIGGDRIIPASAGQTPALKSRHSYRMDHPRECGANNLLFVAHGFLSGSSPRVRGKPGLVVIGHAYARIIPASAGQTRRSWLLAFLSPDHPRECGANIGAVVAALTYFGSSPRVRGKLGVPFDSDPEDRIIPASAGQTSENTGDRQNRADHPRECGANPL